MSGGLISGALISGALISGALISGALMLIEGLLSAGEFEGSQALSKLSEFSKLKLTASVR
jgi:hypothetical protein